MAPLLVIALASLLGSAEPQRLMDGSLIAPSALETHIQGFGAHSDALGPLGNGQSEAVAFNDPIVSAVSVLLDPSRPSTVAGLVVSGIVDPVKALFIGWSGSHVRNEGREGVAPTSADLDAPGSIVLEAGALRRFTTPDHVSPSPVFGSTESTMHLFGDLHGSIVTTLDGGVN